MGWCTDPGSNSVSMSTRIRFSGNPSPNNAGGIPVSVPPTAPPRLLASQRLAVGIAWGDVTAYDGLPFPTTSCTIPLRARSHFVHDPTSCTLFQNSTFAFNLLLLNHIDVCKPNSLIQYSEVVLELSSNNRIYRNRAGGFVWRPERSGKEFNHLFASCNCSSSVAIIASPLVSFECPMAVESSRGVDLIANG
jgi:hypothetical protein